MTTPHAETAAPYVAPAATDLGSVAELTQTKVSTGPDGSSLLDGS